MESIKIEKDGSVSIPYPGNMKITVEMTEGLFEEFLQFRKSKDEFERNRGLAPPYGIFSKSGY